MSSSSDSRRRGREQHCDDGAAAKRPRRGQKHLYLVMDDWEMGYSIHKLEVDAFEPTSDAAAAAGDKLRRLPVPCALRIEVPADRNPAIVTALGSKILLVTDRYSAEAPILTTVTGEGAARASSFLCIPLCEPATVEDTATATSLQRASIFESMSGDSNGQAHHFIKKQARLNNRKLGVLEAGARISA
ncbi:hypothetical protein SEVIR_7G234150v4 [Setaria viridis]|nr:uncharacterized protein LOC117865648 isoform X3 [Setaria viridis]